MKSLSIKLGIILVVGLTVFGHAEAWGADVTPLTSMYGTVIAALRTKNKIVVAADSGFIKEGEKPGTELVCKIRQIGNVFVSVHGLLEYRLTGFEIWDVISLSVRDHGGIAAKAKAFESSVKDPLTRALDQIRLSNPNDYVQQFLTKPAALGVIFFGVDSDTLVLNYRGFKVALGGLEIIRIDCPGGSCPDGNFSYILVGDNKEENEEFKRINFSGPFEENLVDIARKYVQIAIDKNNVKYKAPIDIISIDKSGARWIQKKAECP
jgi:hypothetical protein